MVSFIVPVYNGTKYLRDCVESIVSNCNCDYEIVIVDDGSTDDTSQLSAQITSENKNVKYFRKENGGVSEARNYGIKVACGEWISFVDVDDCFAGKIEETISEDADVVVFSKNFPEKAIFTASDDNFEFLVACVLKQSSCKEYNSCYFNAVWSKLYRTSFIKENNIRFDSKLINGEDSVFNIQCYRYARKVICIPVSIYKWRETKGSATKRYQPGIEETDNSFLQYLQGIICNFKDTEKWNCIYETLALNGLWIVLFQKIAHFRNKSGLQEKKEAYRKLTQKSVYSKAIRQLNSKLTDCPLKRKLILNMMNTPLYPIALMLLRRQTKAQGELIEYLTDI